jgi:hypothetical protein
MRILLLCLFFLLLVQSAAAVVDPRTNLMGLYFDEIGDLQCRDDVEPDEPFSVWLLLTNPTMAFVQGFTCQVIVSGNVLQLAGSVACTFLSHGIEDRDYYVGCDSPIPCFPVTPLIHFQFIIVDQGPLSVSFLVQNAIMDPGPEGKPAILLPDNSTIRVEVSKPIHITENCSLPVESKVWGTIKSLYN